MTKKTAEEQKGQMFVGVFPFQFAETQDKEVVIPTTIHLIPIGQWDHDLYGPIMINNADIREFAQNFNAGIRKGVFITAGHEGYEELPANGWVTSVEVRDDGLWGNVEWNKLGKETLSDKQYKYFSPEFYRDYEDPQTHQIYRNVLTGGALTKSPYFKELEAVVFSDKKLQKQFSTNNNDTMNLKDLLAKDKATLTAEEKAFIKSNAAELTDAEKVSHADVIAEEVKTETEEEKTAREAEAKKIGDENEAKGLNRDGSAKTVDEAAKLSEKVFITAGELAILRQKADAGAEAFKELEKNKLEVAVGAMIFSETNKTGKFLPKDQGTLKSFMETLNPAQRASFAGLIAHLPASDKFKEVGSDSAVLDGTALAEVNSKVDAKIAASEKAGKPMKYSDALKEVMSENEGLEERYDRELPSGRKAQA